MRITTKFLKSGEAIRGTLVDKMTDNEPADTRKALLQLYSTNSTQFATLLLTVALVLFAEVQSLNLPSAFHPLVFGMMVPTIEAGCYFLLAAVYWGKMGRAVLYGGLSTGKDGDLVREYHSLYVAFVKSESSRAKNLVELFDTPHTKAVFLALGASLVIAIIVAYLYPFFPTPQLVFPKLIERFFG